MARQLKVWGGCFDGTTRQIVAAPTKKVAAEALGQTMHGFSDYASETANPDEVDVATSDPGSPFSAPIDARGRQQFVRGLVRYVRGEPWPRTT